jgi:hypothetical protein
MIFWSVAYAGTASESEVMRDARRGLTARDRAVEGWLQGEAASAHAAMRSRTPGRETTNCLAHGRLALDEGESHMRAQSGPRLAARLAEGHRGDRHDTGELRQRGYWLRPAGSVGPPRMAAAASAQELRAVVIRKALSQVQCAGALRQRRHLREDRRGHDTVFPQQSRGACHLVPWSIGRARACDWLNSGRPLGRHREDRAGVVATMR